MASSPPIAVYDACVPYAFQFRNLLVQCAADRLEVGWRSLHRLDKRDVLHYIGL